MQIPSVRGVGRVGSMSPRFYGVPFDYSHRRTTEDISFQDMPRKSGRNEMKSVTHVYAHSVTHVFAPCREGEGVGQIATILRLARSFD